MKTFALSALIAFAATSAFTQTKAHHEEYYVIRDSATKTCTIVDKNPATIMKTTPTPTTIVGLGVFKTRSEAEAGMKKMDFCDDDDDKDKDKDKHHD